MFLDVVLIVVTNSSGSGGFQGGSGGRGRRRWGGGRGGGSARVSVRFEVRTNMNFDIPKGPGDGAYLVLFKQTKIQVYCSSHVV
jgi:hypothetical protein